MTEGIFWETAGEGPPLVLTHGFGDDSTTWDSLWPALSQRHSVLRWDLIGHGRSPRPELAEAYSREVALADLDAMIDRVGGAPVLFGHSLGGYLSLCHAVTRPESVRALVLLSTGPGYRNPEAREGWNRGVQKVADRLDVPPAAGRLVEQHDDLVIAGLDRIRIPVLLICGAKDRAYHAGLQLVERRISGARLQLIDGAGHHVHCSHAEEVQAAIDLFLKELDTSADTTPLTTSLTTDRT